MTDKHPKRPRDPNQLAKSIIDIATGKVPTSPPDDKDPLRCSGVIWVESRVWKARAEKMMPEERTAGAKAA